MPEGTKTTDLLTLYHRQLGDTCLAEMYPSMINVWTKYGEPRLYDKGESDLKSRKLRINLTMSED